jgi:hypothetical protein
MENPSIDMGIGRGEKVDEILFRMSIRRDVSSSKRCAGGEAAVRSFDMASWQADAPSIPGAS